MSIKRATKAWRDEADVTPIGRTIKFTCGSWLACDADTSVYQANPVDAIAGKPAPTFFASVRQSRPARPLPAA
ncbi:hypothetical protein BFW90_03550 [Pseudomonas fluorescens]|nr:hypothetical protein BFW90_03550 [Pseudomonas fluorescens]